MPAKPIEEVIKERGQQIMAIPNVVGIGEGLCDDKPCIKVFVVEITSELEQKIPKELACYPVEIVETGEIRALPQDQG